MTNYIWTVSAGGTITAGGTSTSNTVTVTWNTSGPQTVSVSYTSGTCPASTPTVYNVTVNPAPVPTIGSTNDPCAGSTDNIYYTQTGMTGYVWTVSAGGVIVAGQGTATINVTWNVPGPQFVTVNYTNANGCTAPSPTVYNLFVNTEPNPAGLITGTASLCAGTNGVVYSTTPIVNATSYSWTVPAGATIVAGAGTTSITVNFSLAAVSGNVTVAGTNFCGNGVASSLAVTVNPLPAAAGTITGPANVCANGTGTYTVPAITSATGYVWTIPAGAVITSGANTNTILVTFGNTPATGVITVKGTNACGEGSVSPNFNVTINPVPSAPVVTAVGPLLTSSVATGNQWYYEGTGLIPGATGQTYVATQTGWYWSVVTVNGCSSDTSNHVYVLFVGREELAGASFNLYPVPNNGRFTISIRTLVDESYNVRIYNQLGVMVREIGDISTVGGKYETKVDLRNVADGIYSVVFLNSERKVIRKMVLNKNIQQ
jgi:hypothetical protein